MMKSVHCFSIIILLSLSIPNILTGQLNPWEAAAQMKKGINLGNTLEPPNEGGWNNPLAQEYYFDLYKSAGFNTVRVPVRWDEHTQKTSPYHVNDSWMNRVEQIVDWGLARGFYIIINAHHEEWIKSDYSETNKDRFDSIWAQVSLRFKDKSDKLLFEVINEPYGLTRIENDELHVRTIATIRETNPTRIIIFQGHNWGGSDELVVAAVPDDEYLIGSFHSYDPYLFGLEGQGTWGSSYEITALRNKFLAVKNWSDQKNIPVILGEFGSLRTCDYNSRMKHYRKYVEFSFEFGFIFCAWDDGGDFRIMERQQNKWNELKDLLIHTGADSPNNFKAELFQDTTIQLSWVNMITEADSIIIERRLSLTSEYMTIAVLSADSSSYRDENCVQNLNYYYRISVYKDGVKNYAAPAKIYLPVYVPKVRSLFHGSPIAIPGIIEAEDFDIGGEGLTYHDSNASNIAGDYRPDEAVDIYERPNGDGFHIGNADPGEWYEYTVNVEKDGNYLLDVYIAAIQSGGTFSVKVGDSESGILSTVSSNSWLTTTKISANMSLNAGEQILRFTVLGKPLFNIDKYVFTGLTAIDNELSGKLQAYQDIKGHLIIRLNDDSILESMQLFDIRGNLVQSVISPDTRYEIPTQSLSPGIYFIKCQSPSGITSAKIYLN